MSKQNKSLAHFNTQFKVKESFKLLLVIKVKITLGDKSQNILATKTAIK